jgi:hypothetical protein
MKTAEVLERCSKKDNRKYGDLMATAGKRKNILYSECYGNLHRTECSVIQYNSAMTESKKFPFNGCL